MHADDFGETREITAGICQGIDAGVITSTSVLANMPDTLEALARIPPLASRASFGAHLNLCEGRPLSRGFSAVDTEGRFAGKHVLVARALTGRLPLKQVEAELTAQLGRLVDAGLRLSHVDGHKHLHQLPVVASAVAAVLPRFAIERVRVTRSRGLGPVRGGAGRARERLAGRAAGVFAAAGLRYPSGTLEVRDLMRDDGLLWRLAHQPGRGGSGVFELCCHPGTAAADRLKPGSHERARELTFLLSAEFRTMLDESGALRGNYWRI